MTDQNPAFDHAAVHDYAARVLAHPHQHSTEAVEAARALQHLLPAPPRPTLADMTISERADAVGMWATIDPDDGGNTWRGVITRATRYVILVGSPTYMRMGMKPIPVSASTVTPDPTVPRAWNADGTPVHLEPAPALPEKWRIADHEEHGRVIVTNPDPSTDGMVCCVFGEVDLLGYRGFFCNPDELTYIDHRADQ